VVRKPPEPFSATLAPSPTFLAPGVDSEDSLSTNFSAFETLPLLLLPHLQVLGGEGYRSSHARREMYLGSAILSTGSSSTVAMIEFLRESVPSNGTIVLLFLPSLIFYFLRGVEAVASRAKSASRRARAVSEYRDIANSAESVSQRIKVRSSPAHRVSREDACFISATIETAYLVYPRLASEKRRRGRTNSCRANRRKCFEVRSSEIRHFSGGFLQSFDNLKRRSVFGSHKNRPLSSLRG